MNLANLITFSRLVVTVGVLVCLEAIADLRRPDHALAWWAFGMFMYAALSDYADGWIARRYGQETKLGRIVDPFADKFLICGTWISLLRFVPHVEALDQCLQTWMVIVIVSREFLVTTIRSFAEAAGVKFAADRLGKVKMVAQCTALSAQLTMVAGTQVFFWFAYWGMVVTLIVTVGSGISYVMKARPLLRG